MLDFYGVRVYVPLYYSDDLRWRCLAFYVFTHRSTHPTTSGGTIFLCLKKDSGERRASSSQAPHPSFCLSGQKLSRSAAPPLPTKPTSLGFGGAPIGGPLNPRGNVLGHSDVLCAYHLATVRVTRLSRLRRSAYPLASACCGAQEDRKSYGATQLSTTNQAGYSFSSNDFAAVEAVQSSPWKQCGARHGRA